MCLGIVYGHVMHVRPDTGVRPIHTYIRAFTKPSLNHRSWFVPVTTTPSFVFLVLINPSLVLALRNAVKDLNPECLISTRVSVGFLSREEQYDRIYVS